MRFYLFIALLSFAFFRPSPIHAQVQPDTTFPDPKDIKSPLEADSAIAFSLRRIVETHAPFTPFTNLATAANDSLSNYIGQYVLLNFWSLSCKPCIKEMPDISDLQDQYYQAGLRVLFLAPNDLDSQNRFFATHKTSGIKGITKLRLQSRQFRMLSSALPTLILIDRDGFIKDAWNGAIGYEAIEKRINTLIPQALRVRSKLLYYIGFGFVLAALALMYLSRLRVRYRRKKHENGQQSA